MMIFEGEWSGGSIHWSLEDGTYLIGRDSRADLRIVDRSVSREHAQLTIRRDEVDLRDLGSRNGTWVGGSRIEGSRLLVPHDRVRFGNVEILFRPSGVEPREASGTDTRSILSDGEGLHTSYRLSWDLVQEGQAALSGHERKLLTVVLEAGHLLVEHQPLEQVFESVLELVGRVIPTRRALLLICEVEGEMPVVRAVRPASVAGERIMLSHTMIDMVLQRRESILVTDAQTDERFREQQSIVAQNIRAAMVAPLFDNERVIGLIYADSSDPLVAYEDDQLRALSLLANLIAVKITQTRLLLAQQEQERMAQEMETAARIQRSLLPAVFPPAEGYEILARQIPCREVGGDLYDGAVLPDGRLGLILGDVSGKGMGAAILMSNVMASLRVMHEEGLPLDSLVERLNRHVLRATEPMHYVTLFLSRLDSKEHTLEYANAGHPSPLLLTPDGEVRHLESNGPPVGLLPGSSFATSCIGFPPGGLLCVFSDGITEAAAADDEFFEEDRVASSLRNRRDRSLEEIASGLLEDVAAFLDGAPAGDDVTLLLVRRTGGAAATA